MQTQVIHELFDQVKNSVIDVSEREFEMEFSVEDSNKKMVLKVSQSRIDKTHT